MVFQFSKTSEQWPHPNFQVYQSDILITAYATSKQSCHSYVFMRPIGDASVVHGSDTVHCMHHINPMVSNRKCGFLFEVGDV